MRFLLDQKSYEEMQSRRGHSRDCYVRNFDYLHHLYVDGVKYTVARAVYACYKEAQAKKDQDAMLHLAMHIQDLEQAIAEARERGENIAALRAIGDPPPSDEEARPQMNNSFLPEEPATIEETGLNRTFLTEHFLRLLYNKGRATGREIADDLCLFYRIVEQLIIDLRNLEQIDIIGQKGFGDINYEYALTARGGEAALAALKKTQYAGPCPVNINDWFESVKAQTVKNVKVTRRNIRDAFEGLVIDESILNMVGPAVNSGSSMMLFGYPGNGKTTIAERITHLMGDDIFIPNTIYADGAVIKMFDSIVHEKPRFALKEGVEYDKRWVRISRPVVIVGGELTLDQLNLVFNETSRIYEAPFQMKANCGIFLIDDFGRQQVRVFDLLNRWIVPLEKRYDFLNTVTGQKIQIPFDQLIMFSTNLDPNDLGDDALLRRIKFKFEIIDPTEDQFRDIWKIMCKVRKVPYDERSVSYLIAKWYLPDERPFRMCQPRDILDQLISIARYNMETPTLSADLIDAACLTYFPNKEKKNFGAKVRLDM
ncbi:AAA family ATPase [Candidatus Viridilinea mediisalina]|uniref:AAA family ATPase n=1 Tax=Candidatus Viridilinea mediisalina TaxID=2024553 RepID=A0A2A6RJT4_9CHLR|nr:AAA family ATPase [Candidatus Viridilinea mediisalina]PDW03120.1 AAA family ATPase [Candidatus Viridilinea mediisalina]